MAYFDQSYRAPSHSGASFFSNAIAALQQYRMMRRTYTELSSLSDRELDDLGIVRADLKAIARKSSGYAA